jgi:uncharacterized protein
MTTNKNNDKMSREEAGRMGGKSNNKRNND